MSHYKVIPRYTVHIPIWEQTAKFIVHTYGILTLARNKQKLSPAALTPPDDVNRRRQLNQCRYGYNNTNLGKFSIIVPPIIVTTDTTETIAASAAKLTLRL